MSASRVRTDRHAEAVSTKPRSGEVGPPSAALVHLGHATNESGEGGPRCRFSNASARSRSKHPPTRLSRFSISRENPHGPICASATSIHGIDKRIVFILRSDVASSRHYVGVTNDLRARLEWHNQGPCGHTLSHRPWSVVVSLEFPTEKEAVRFEKYWKSGSGRAFATRHLG